MFQKSPNLDVLLSLLEYSEAAGRLVWKVNRGRLANAGTGLVEFCRINGLRRPKMTEVWYGSRNHHKGWTKANA
jgi:hypothetical protein